MFIAALAAMAALPAFALDAFTSPTQIRAELLQLTEVTDSSEARAAQLAPLLSDSSRTLSAAQAELSAAIDEALALDEAIARKQLSGDLATLERNRLGEIRVAAVMLGRRVNEAVSRRDLLAAQILDAERRQQAAAARQQVILARYRQALAPVYLSGVAITFTDPRDGEDDVIYDAGWSSPRADEINDRVIGQLIASLEDLEIQIATLQRSFDAAEARFIAADQKWQSRNADYISNVAGVATAANILLELGDVGVGVAMAGPGWPAALAFEAIYRPAEAIYKGAPASSLPTVSDDIIAARERLSSSVGIGVLDAGAPGARPNPFGGFRTALYAEEKAELVKNAFGIGYQGLAENVAQAAVPYFRGAAEAGVDTGWQKLALSLAGREDATLLGVYKALGGTTRQEAAEFATLMRRVADPTLVDGLFVTLGRGAFWLEVGKGVGAGLLITAAKEGLKQPIRNEAQAIFEDLARIELEWFVRQRALQTVSFILQMHREVQKGLTVALGQAVAKRDEEDAGRRLTVTDSSRIVLSDWQLAQGVWLRLNFSERLLATRFGFADGPLQLSGGSPSTQVSRLARAVIGEADAPVKLRLEVRPDGAWELHDGYDADPATVARLSADGTWIARETGLDTAHDLTFATPLLRLAGDPEQLRVGVDFEVAYRAPSNAREGAWIALVEPGVAPVVMPPQIAEPTAFAQSNVALPGTGPDGHEGVVTLNPDAAGRYEIRMYDRGREGVSVASIAVCVMGMAEPCDDEVSPPEPLPESCIPGAGPRRRVASTFGSGPEGWSLAGDAGPEAEFVAGSIAGTDLENSSVWYFQAPPNYLGDHSGLFGSRLSYRLRVTEVTKFFKSADVVIEAKNGSSITVETGTAPGMDWTDYSFALDTTGGWVLDGRPATSAEICRVLGSISSVKIRGEFHTGPDTGWLGGVSFGE
ncbi:laminin B domain-containing protein [Devosia insulae]|uniref:laminin B domain-containing protein n=1 Tax=Devosia insulae TaxID=408174 RepID=UPI00159F1AC3|nr:laminin B domain-containing protein [Devosia insulae]